MLFILLIAVHIVTAVSVKLIPDQKDNGIAPLVTCSYEIYKLHRKFHKLTIVLYANKIEEDVLDDGFTETIVDILIANKNPFIKTNDVKQLNEITRLHDNTLIIVAYLKSCNELKDLELIRFDVKFRYIIIINAFLNEECHEAVKTKLSEVDNYDVTFLTADREIGKYNLITVIPERDAITCDVAKVKVISVINICYNGSLDKKRVTAIFPSKLPTDLKMCNFNVGMATLYPYSMLNNKGNFKNLDPLENIYGSDLEIIKILAKKFNGTLKLFYIQRDEENQLYHLELVQYLLNGTLDACAGGLYRIYGDEVAYSGIYSRQSVIWIYTVERTRRSWQSLAVKITGLYIFLIFYLCYAIMWNIITKFEYQIMSIIDSLVYGWGALVGAAGLQNSRCLKQKILNIMYLILCLHLSAYVSTQIYYYLTIAEPPQHFKEVDELRSSDRIPYLVYAAKYFVDDKKYIAYANTSRNCDNFKDCEDMMLKNKGSTLILDGRLPLLQSSSAVNDEARVLRVTEDFLVVYHEMVIRKNSAQRRLFQKTISRLFEVGICQKLYLEAIGITVVDKSKIANKNILSNSYSCLVGCKITLSQSAGIFYIWITGCALSCCVFVLEILMKSLNFGYV